jgi:hypothetical protein
MVKCAGVLLKPREFPCDFFLWGHMKDFVYSTPIGTMELLREQVGNPATSIPINRGMLKFNRRFHYCIGNNAVPLNTSCND